MGIFHFFFFLYFQREEERDKFFFLIDYFMGLLTSFDGPKVLGAAIRLKDMAQ